MSEVSAVPALRSATIESRPYYPETARFLQPDPIPRQPNADRFTHTLYAYAGGDPVNYVDRNGAEAVAAFNELSILGSPFEPASVAELTPQPSSMFQHEHLFHHFQTLKREDAKAANTPQSIKKMKRLLVIARAYVADVVTKTDAEQKQEETIGQIYNTIKSLRAMGTPTPNDLNNIDNWVVRKIAAGQATQPERNTYIDMLKSPTLFTKARP